MPGRFIDFNKNAYKRLGYSKKEYMALSPMEIVAKEKIASIPDHLAEVWKRKSFTFETICVKKTGALCYLLK